MPYAPDDPRRLATQHRYNTSDKGRETMRAWRNAHRDRVAEYSRSDKGREWQRTHRERMKADAAGLARMGAAALCL